MKVNNRIYDLTDKNSLQDVSYYLPDAMEKNI